MSRDSDWLPQFNWPVFGPLLGAVVALIVVAFVVGARLWPAGGPSAFGTNPDRDAPVTATAGRGGPGPMLLPPEVRELKLHSLPARVNGTPTVRSGPGTQYGGVYQLTAGEEVHVIACSPDCEWLRILSLADAQAQLWVPAVFVSVNGRTESLPVLTPR
jgi:hypothetical protein